MIGAASGAAFGASSRMIGDSSRTAVAGGAGGSIVLVPLVLAGGLTGSTTGDATASAVASTARANSVIDAYRLSGFLSSARRTIGPKPRGSPATSGTAVRCLTKISLSVSPS